jgi:hypothetical protein
MRASSSAEAVSGSPAAPPGIRGRARSAVPTTPRPLIPGSAASALGHLETVGITR